MKVIEFLCSIDFLILHIPLPTYDKVRRKHSLELLIPQRVVIFA